MEVIKDYEESEGLIIAQHIFSYIYNKFRDDFSTELCEKMKDTINCISKYMDHDFQELNCDIIDQSIFRRVILDKKD